MGGIEPTNERRLQVKPPLAALNRIWKSLPPAAREVAKGDFRLLTDLVKEKSNSVPVVPAEAPVNPEYDFENRYLDGMSKVAKAYALKCLTQEHRDVYKEIADLIVSNKIRDMDALWDTYRASKEVAPGDISAIREIMCFCLERARIQSLV